MSTIAPEDVSKVLGLAEVARAHIKSETSEDKHQVVDDLIDIGTKIVLNLLAN